MLNRPKKMRNDAVRIPDSVCRRIHRYRDRCTLRCRRGRCRRSDTDTKRNRRCWSNNPGLRILWRRGRCRIRWCCGRWLRCDTVRRWRTRRCPHRTAFRCNPTGTCKRNPCSCSMGCTWRRYGTGWERKDRVPRRSCVPCTEARRRTGSRGPGRCTILRDGRDSKRSRRRSPG